MAHHQQQSRDIDTTEVVRYLIRAFNRAADSAAPAIGNKAVRTLNGKVDPTILYYYQCDMAYVIDNIQRGPKYIAPKYIQEANEIIAALAAEG